MNLYYFNINKNCNSNCIFCAADYEKMVSRNIISNSYICFEDFKNIAENISIKQEDRVIINGGEPTLNPDLIKILNYCSLLEAETILFTNGRKLGNTGYAKSILQSGISKITISDCSSETHRRKNQLILSEEDSQWYNPVYFAKIIM